jgi:hypothetical protein
VGVYEKLNIFSNTLYFLNKHPRAKGATQFVNTKKSLMPRLAFTPSNMPKKERASEVMFIKTIKISIGVLSTIV